MAMFLRNGGKGSDKQVGNNPSNRASIGGLLPPVQFDPQVQQVNDNAQGSRPFGSFPSTQFDSQVQQVNDDGQASRPFGSFSSMLLDSHLQHVNDNSQMSRPFGPFPWMQFDSRVDQVNSYGRNYELDHTNSSANLQTNEGVSDPNVDHFLMSDKEKWRKYYEEYYRNEYNEALKKIEESADKKMKEKEMERVRLTRKLLNLENKTSKHERYERYMFEEEMKAKETKMQQLIGHMIDSEQKLAHCKMVLEATKEDVTKSEKTINYVREAQQKVAALDGGGRSGGRVGQVEEGGGSEVEPVRVPCKMCGNRLATVMMWPCKHLCVCLLCWGSTRVCPVCNCVPQKCVELILPPPQ